MGQHHLAVRLQSDDFDTSAIEVHSLEGRESISQLFRFDLSIVSTNPQEPTADTLAGAAVTLVFLRDGEELRHVHGMIAEVDEDLETEVHTRAFRIQVVPRLFRSSLVESDESHLDLSVPEIIQHKLSLVGLEPADLAFRLVGSYPKLEFVVQYKETDLAYISRLAEHIGISYFFEHARNDRLVFTDHNQGFPKLPARLPFRARGEQCDVHSLSAHTRLLPRVVFVRDYNYRLPQVDLTASADVNAGFAGGVVDFGSHVKTPEAAKALAQIRSEELAATHRVYRGESDVPAIAAGWQVRLENHPSLEDDALLITAVEHHVTLPALTHGGGEGHSYQNTFHAIDARLPYRPPRVTPRPRIYGLLTGVVQQDPSLPVGQYAQLDAEGRYLIRFLFDSAVHERQPSRRVRMIQASAGPDYGIHFPLRPGVEVLVAFVDGDPDRPIIVGAAPNPKTPTPVNAGSALTNRLKTATGVLIEMKDT